MMRIIAIMVIIIEIIVVMVVLEEILEMFLEVEFKIGISPSSNLKKLTVIEDDEGKVNVVSRFGRKSRHLN